MKIKNSHKILKILLKERLSTITSLAQEIKLSRVGTWKILKNLEQERMIILSSIGAGETSIYTVHLNWENPLQKKMLALILTEDALMYQRWITNFKDLENKVDFTILYGSILHSLNQANDIDIINVISSDNKNKFLEIEDTLKKIQKTLMKEIHAQNLTKKELEEELKKSNKAFVDAIKKGVVLFGQEKFIDFMESEHEKRNSRMLP